MGERKKNPDQIFCARSTHVGSFLIIHGSLVDPSAGKVLQVILLSWLTTKHRTKCTWAILPRWSRGSRVLESLQNFCNAFLSPPWPFVHIRQSQRTYTLEQFNMAVLRSPSMSFRFVNTGLVLLGDLT